MTTPKAPAPLVKAESRLRDVALALPEATEAFPWGHRAIKVKGKAFLFMSLDDGALSLSVKLPQSRKSALALPFVAPTGYGLGKAGWVTATFQRAADVKVDALADWIEESYRAIAPKKLVASLDMPAEPKPKKRSTK